MAADYRQIMAEHDGFMPVADTTIAVTFDLEKAEMVVIVADPPVTTGFLPRLNLLGVG